MKKLVRFAVMTACVMMCWSCIDEEDFDFDRLSQTTINPALGVRLFDTEVKLSDFLNFDSLLADVEGMELISRNDGNGEYLEFVYTRSDTFDVNDFVGIIDGMSDVSIELPAISVPDVSSLVSSGVDLSDVSVAYPALGVEMEDISVEVPEIEEGVSIDSLILTSGGIGIQSSTVLPFDVYYRVKCVRNQGYFDRNAIYAAYSDMFFDRNAAKQQHRPVRICRIAQRQRWSGR